MTTRDDPRGTPAPGQGHEPWAAHDRQGPSAEGSGTGANPSDAGLAGSDAGLVGRLGVALKEFLLVVAMALVISFVVKTWLVQAFYIPSGSMEDTLLVGDRVVVNKLVPAAMDLHRGDIVVFEDPDSWLPPSKPTDRGPIVNGIQRGLSWVGLLPDMAEDHLIKRVIGLPGDRVACCGAGGRLTVNGVAITEPYIYPGDAPSAVDFSVTVPAGRIWVMGDHRSDSDDSRFHDVNGNGVDGSVPISRITGRAFALVWPVSRWSTLSDEQAVFAGVPRP